MLIWGGGITGVAKVIFPTYQSGGFPPLPHFDPLLSIIYRLALTDLDPWHAADIFELLAAIYKTTTEAINLGRDLIKATVEPPHCISVPVQNASEVTK